MPNNNSQWSSSPDACIGHHNLNRERINLQKIPELRQYLPVPRTKVLGTTKTHQQKPDD